ncbi:copper(I)-binding protein [Pseudomonas sp. TE3786]
MRWFKSLFTAVAVLSLSFAAMAHEYEVGELHIDHPWSREMPPTAPTAAVYFIIHNKGASADRLLSVDTPAAGKAEMHEHIDQNGLMKMQQVQFVTVPAGGEATFAPMAYHVMLFNLKQQGRDGERFPLTLHFEKAGEVTVQVAVQKEAPAEQHDMSQHKN